MCVNASNLDMRYGLDAIDGRENETLASLEGGCWAQIDGGKKDVAR